MYFTNVIDFIACKYTAVAPSVICLYLLLLVDIFLSLAIVQSISNFLAAENSESKIQTKL